MPVLHTKDMLRHSYQRARRVTLAAMMYTLLLTVVLVMKLLRLHGPTGQEIDINPHEVSSLREPSEGSEGHFGPGTQCLIFMTNGKVNAVTEHCENIRGMIEEAKE